MYGGSMIKIGASKDVTIKGFSNIHGNDQSLRAIMLHGSKNPTIRENRFTKVDRIIQISPWKNNNSGSEYEITYNHISEKNKNDMLNNSVSDIDEYFEQIKGYYCYFKSTSENRFIRLLLYQGAKQNN